MKKVLSAILLLSLLSIPIRTHADHDHRPTADYDIIHITLRDGVQLKAVTSNTPTTLQNLMNQAKGVTAIAGPTSTISPQINIRQAPQLRGPALYKSGQLMGDQINYYDLGNLYDQDDKSFICVTATTSGAAALVVMGTQYHVAYNELYNYLGRYHDCRDAIYLGNDAQMIYKNDYVTPFNSSTPLITSAYVIVDPTIQTITPSDELQQATTQETQDSITRMYQNGMTDYKVPKTFRPNDNITRQEAAKIFTIFAINIFDIPNPYQNQPNPGCNYADISTASASLAPRVTRSCNIGIFKQQTNFHPSGTFTRAQAITITMRVIEGNQPEPYPDYRTNYMNDAITLGLIQSMNPTSTITRGEVANLLHDASAYAPASQIDY